MAQETINIGSFPNDPNSDAIRTAFLRVQNNFTELYQTVLSTGVVQIIAADGLSQNRDTGNVIIKSNVTNMTIRTGSSLVVGLGPNASGNTATLNYLTSNVNVPFKLDLANTITTTNAVFSNTTTVNLGVSGYLTTNLIPSGNMIINLGSETHRFKDLFLSGNTIQIGSTNISTSGNSVVLPNTTISGNLNAGTVSATYVSGALTTSDQPNITSVGTLANLTVDGGDLTIANANVHISTAGKGLFVDNLYYANGVAWDMQQPAGSNTQIVFNDSNNFGASSQFTFDKSSNTLTVGDNTYNTTVSSGNIDTTGDISGNNLSITSQIFADTIDVTGNITATVGTLTANKGVFYDDTGLTGGNLTVTGGGHIELNGSTIDLTNNQAGVFNTGITDINIGLGANVTLSDSGLLTTVRGNLEAQNLDISGNITAGNINLTNVVVTNTSSGNLTVNNLKVTNLLSNRNLINVSNNTTLDSFPINRYRTAKYTIRIGSDDGFQAIEVLLVHDDLTAHVTVYGSLSTSGTDLVYLTAEIVSSIVYLKATATSTNTTANMIASYVTD